MRLRTAFNFGSRKLFSEIYFVICHQTALGWVMTIAATLCQSSSKNDDDFYDLCPSVLSVLYKSVYVVGSVHAHLCCRFYSCPSVLPVSSPSVLPVSFKSVYVVCSILIGFL
jgi:hypothetical protein